MTDLSTLGQSHENNIKDADDLLNLFAGAENLPTLPEVAVRLLNLLDDPQSSAKDVAQLLKEDPAISVKVLKMVNSALYAPTTCREITNLQMAISRMGFVTVANIALSTSVFQAFGNAKRPAFNRADFWRHCVNVGIVASVLYEHSEIKDDQRYSRDTVHLAGIVHDIGKILFELYVNILFHQAIQRSRTQKIPLENEERHIIRMGHHQAGAWLANRWHLPEMIVSVIQWHHSPCDCPNEASQPLVKLVHMADYICHKLNLGDSGNYYPQYDQRVREELDITPAKITEMMDDIKEETTKSQVLLSLV